MISPKYKHDCDICVFLGTYQNQDLYEHCGIRNTVIARYGDEGSEYESGLDTAKSIYAYNPKHPLAEAYRRSRFFQRRCNNENNIEILSVCSFN